MFLVGIDFEDFVDIYMTKWKNNGCLNLLGYALEANEYAIFTNALS